MNSDAHGSIADTIIVGAGVTGLSTALHLRERGVSRVIVLERHHIAAGQSGHAAGMVRALMSHALLAATRVESLQFFTSLAERYDENLAFHRVGYLRLAAESESEAFDKLIATSQGVGCKVSRITAKAAAELQPGLRQEADDIYAFEPEALYIDPAYTTQAMGRIAVRSGVKILEGCEVRAILSEGGHVTGVETTQGRFQAPKVLIATSVWGPALLHAAGVKLPVYPHRVEMAFFSASPYSPLRLTRMMSDSKTNLYVRPEGANEMFVGWREGYRIHGRADLSLVDPDNYRQTTRYESLRNMHRQLAAMLPFMSEGFVHRTYACVYDYCPDTMPILDRSESIQGLYYAVGFSGDGFSLSPWTGRVMALFMTEEKKPHEMEFLGRNRFGANGGFDW